MDIPTKEQIIEILTSLFSDQANWWQWGAIAVSIILAIITKLSFRNLLKKAGSKFDKMMHLKDGAHRGVSSIPFFFCLYLWLLHTVFIQQDRNCGYIYTAASLITAACIYKVAVSMSHAKLMPRFIGLAVLILFILAQLDWLEPIKQVLTSISIPVGDINIDIYKIISAFIALFVLLWLVGIFTRVVDNTVQGRKEIPPSIRVLIGKASRLTLYAGAFLISLKVAGFPLGALAVFSGALGLGLGFGLQKVISNLVSGIIILLDKSIKPGDVIEINGTYGWINTLRTRYVSVLTRDRKEILIPNEDFITNNVVNWSFSDTNVRIRANIGVAYDTDVEHALKTCTEAAKNIPRILKNPAPASLLLGFGDSSIDLQIRFWINDASEGVANVRSQVLLEVWKAFRDEGINIPFPQREITIKQVNEEDTQG